MRTSYGPPDVVRIAEVDKPTPKDDQVVKVHATTVNRTDCGFPRASPSSCGPSPGCPAKGDGPGDRVRRNRGGGRR